MTSSHMKPPTSQNHASGATMPRIPVAAPVLDGRETEYVMECMQTSWISSNGRFIGAFEEAFAKFLGVLVPTLGTGEEAIFFRHKFAEPVVLTLPLPWLSQPLEIFKRAEFTISAGQLVAVAVVAFLTVLNCRGVREGKWVQNLFTVAKTGALIALIVLGLTVAANPEAIRAGLRVVLADDSVLLREGISRLLSDEGIDVVGEAGDAAALLALVADERPDIAVVDIRMPPTHTTEGIVAAATIRADHPDTAVVLLSQYVETDHVMNLIADGAADGSIRPVDPFLAAQMVSAAVNAAADLIAWTDGLTPDRVIDIYARPALTGLLAP